MVEEPLQPQTAQPEEGPVLTGEQVKTLDRISPLLDRFQCHLVDGVTGSGKTEVYMRLLQMMFDRGRQALVLVPEIGLTPQLIRRFRQRLGIEPAVIHSRLTGGERLAAWNAARTGRSRLLLGTRSALFTPLPDLGLIVLDEEHDSSFKQQDGFRHSARDVAIKWAADLNIPVVLGSATPSLESVHNALNNKYVWHRMRRRATRAPQPRWRVLDMAQQPVASGLAAGTIEAIDETLRRREQVMVFLNRRGYSPVLMCRECGWHAECNRCDANLTWHRAVGAMCCHHCGSRRPVPSLCPECRADAIFSAGEGTQQLEEALAGRFPGIPLLRFDRDQISAKGVLDRQIEQVMSGERCIMVGTQILAKGHHFPNVTLVAIVNVDQALYSADYRALERLAQLIQQVAGRAGRADKPGEVILQTMHPEHQTLQLLLREGYESFARFLLQERQAAGLPPYGYQAMLRADAHDREDVDRFLSDALELWPRGDVSAFGPIPAIMEKRGGRMRMYLVMQSSLRPALHQQLDLWLPGVRELPSARKVRWVVDIDPQEM
jgi:primosomal protein N' (replication factor Y)